MITVDVNLAERSYPIYIQAGLLDQLPVFMQNHGLDDSLFVITDENVENIYGERIRKLFQDSPHMQLLSVPAGEPSKSLDQANALYTQLLQSRANRNSVIVAFGGGVVGDLAGFVAATFMRGIRFVQVPTTILAQVDSSVGGKVGINHALGKNLIGAFYQPQFVLIDPETLKTLPQRQIRAGSAEIIKYGFIQDVQFYNEFVTHLDEFYDLKNTQFVESVLQKSCQVKADVVSQDERESDLRAILNFGHTVGHALEAITQYSYFLHGEAIIHGMKAALYLSFLAGHLTRDKVLESCSHLDRFSAPDLPADIKYETLIAAMQQDKKRSSKGQLWVLLETIGNAILTREVGDSQLEQAIDFMVAQSRTWV